MTATSQKKAGGAQGVATVTVAAVGEVDLQTRHLLFDVAVRAIEQAAEEQAALDQRLRVVLDLSGVGFMDCAGLAAVVIVAAAAARVQAKLVVGAAQPGLLRLFELTGLAATLPLDPPASSGAAVSSGAH